MKQRTIRILAITVTVQLVVLALVLWARRDTGSALEAYDGSNGYLVITTESTDVGPNPYFGPTERAVLGAVGGEVQTRTDSAFGAFGAYGDTLESTCDPAALSRFLGEVNAPRGEVWAKGQGVEPSAINAFVGGLKTSVLGEYTLVTMHQFHENGTDVAEQTVLAPGTAVLIDSNGDPRVRCLSGSPVTAAPSTDPASAPPASTPDSSTPPASTPPSPTPPASTSPASTQPVSTQQGGN